MAKEFMESRETFEGFNEYNSGYDLIQMQLNEAIAAGDEDLVRYYKNQFAKMQSMTENDAKAGKDIKLGGGLSAYQVLRMGANDDLRKAEELRRKGNSSKADYYENRGNATMKRYEAAVAQNKAEAERIKKEAEESRQRDKEYREKEEAEKRKLEEQKKAEQNKS